MKTWILLRGLMRESRHWGRFTTVLQENNPKDRIISIDWPGNGQLHQHDSHARIETMVAHLRHTLAEQDLRPPYHVIAISLGAMAAVDWCQTHPDEISKCILINTSLQPFSRFYHRLSPRNYLALLLVLLLNDKAKKEKIILNITSQTRPPASLQQWISYQEQYPISRKNALRQLSAAMHYRAPSQQPAVPMLLLNAARDQLVNPRCSNDLITHWNRAGTCHKGMLTLRTHPTAGHDLPLDDADWIISTIRDWMHQQQEHNAIN